MKDFIIILFGVFIGLTAGVLVTDYVKDSERQIVVVANPPKFTELRESVEVIMTETRAGGNTKVRIGMMYLDIIRKMEHMQFEIDSIKQANGNLHD